MYAIDLMDRFNSLELAAKIEMRWAEAKIYEMTEAFVNSVMRGITPEEVNGEIYDYLIRCLHDTTPGLFSNAERGVLEHCLRIIDYIPFH